MELVEKVSLDIFFAMKNPRRIFHTLDHLSHFDSQDSLERIAVMYHDVVYWNVDGTWPEVYIHILEPLCDKGMVGGQLSLQSDLKYFHEILSLFQRKPGETISGPGSNELFSAIVFASVWNTLFDREQLFSVIACIEATIPFRGESATNALYENLIKLNFTPDKAQSMVMRALHMAHQDVQDFQKDDPGEFLSGTWNLIPELNQDLRIQENYTTQSYRKAIMGMLGFLDSLQVEQIFHSWKGYPQDSELQGIYKRAHRNLAVGYGYLQAKLVTAAILEAFSLVTGGDAPLSLFMGSTNSKSPESTLEYFLPDWNNENLDDPVYYLLQVGRAQETSFDLKNSPLASYVYTRLGSEGCDELTNSAKQMFKNEMEPQAFIERFDSIVKQELLSALAQFVVTRREKFQALML